MKKLKIFAGIPDGGLYFGRSCGYIDTEILNADMKENVA